MGGIGTDKACPRCGDQIVLTVATPGPIAFASPLEELLHIDYDERIIIFARCGCPAPRFVGLRGTSVYEDDIQ